MNDNNPNNLFLVCHDICFVHLVIRSNCVVLCRIVLYYVIVQFFILYLCLIVIYLSSSTIIFNINFLAHGKKDNYCLHETTVESIFKLLIYKICYNTCALMLKYIFIHSFIHSFNLFTTCSQLVHDLFTTCSRLVHDSFTTHS